MIAGVTKLAAAALEVRAGQVWADEERGRVTVLAVADGYAMLKRRRRNPFIATVGQMLAGEYGWELLEDSPTPDSLSIG